MTNQHPITPPPELVGQWSATIYQKTAEDDERDHYIATQAAQWGADQELEECCEWLDRNNHLCPWATVDIDELRDARRPKPPSLKEQALKALHTSVDLDEFPKQYDTIRRALNELPNN
jgi:hypothetical protein